MSNVMYINSILQCLNNDICDNRVDWPLHDLEPRS